jgi:hypothetical protein
MLRSMTSYGPEPPSDATAGDGNRQPVTIDARSHDAVSAADTPRC